MLLKHFTVQIEAKGDQFQYFLIGKATGKRALAVSRGQAMAAIRSGTFASFVNL